MRKFKVAIKTDEKVTATNLTVSISADDFNTEQVSDDKGIYFNFWVQPEGEDAHSVGAVPFENVLYIVEES